MESEMGDVKPIDSTQDDVHVLFDRESSQTVFKFKITSSPQLVGKDVMFYYSKLDDGSFGAGFYNCSTGEVKLSDGEYKYFLSIGASQELSKYC